VHLLGLRHPFRRSTIARRTAVTLIGSYVRSTRAPLLHQRRNDVETRVVEPLSAGESSEGTTDLARIEAANRGIHTLLCACAHRAYLGSAFLLPTFCGSRKARATGQPKHWTSTRFRLTPSHTHQACASRLYIITSKTGRCQLAAWMCGKSATKPTPAVRGGDPYAKEQACSLGAWRRTTSAGRSANQSASGSMSSIQTVQLREGANPHSGPSCAPADVERFSAAPQGKSSSWLASHLSLPPHG